MKEISQIKHSESNVLKRPVPKYMGLGQLLIKSTGLAILFFLIMVLLTLFVVGLFAYTKANRFVSAVPLTWSDIKQLAIDTQSHQINQQNQMTNFLILGVDTVANKPGAPQLTDTIILASLDFETGQLNLLSLPRDLWSEEYQTKINALYHYGLQKDTQYPATFPTDVISEMTGVPINYTLIISLETLANLVDAVDGISVNVSEGFTDEEFPRSDVDVTTTSDPNLLYKTVTFATGPESMNGERVLEYIRSRHSMGDTGTDINRSERQQVVIAALIDTLRQPDVILDPEKAAQLYNLYDAQLASQLPLLDLLVLGKILFPVRNNIELHAHQLSIADDNKSGVIEHPPTWRTQDQWTYTIVDDSQFKNEIAHSLGMIN